MTNQVTTTTPLSALGERYFSTQHGYDPYSATLLGLQDFDHLSTDPSLEASEAAADEFDRIGVELAAIDPSALGAEERIDYDVLSVLNWGAGSDARHSLWAVNASAKSYISRQALIFQAMPAMTITDADGGDRYLSRLSGVSATLRGLADRYAVELNRGTTPVATSVAQAIQQLEGYLAIPIEQDSLLAPTRSAAGQAVRDRALAIVRDDIRPAMAYLADRERTELLPVARDDDHSGISAVPGGAEAYVDAARRHTTTSLTPAEIHERGLEILAGMREQWSTLGERAIGERDFTIIAERLREDPALRFETRQQIVDVAERALARAEAARDHSFPPYRIPDCVIEEINPIEAENSALAYYRLPAADGSRPGAHCLLTTDPASRYSYEYEALAFHESSPGHHLQLATAQTLDIPRYRRYLDTELCGFIEGWGLYAEQLADEMDLYTDDLQRLGMLSFAALRATRLVVDTGIHHHGWTRERAMEFMWDNTVTTRANVRNEIDRYIAWPGQALAYMIGRQEILRLRAESQAVLGDRFSMIDFHGTVLGSGAVPLSVLERNVANWRESTMTGTVTR